MVLPLSDFRPQRYKIFFYFYLLIGILLKCFNVFFTLKTLALPMDELFCEMQIAKYPLPRYSNDRLSSFFFSSSALDLRMERVMVQVLSYCCDRIRGSIALTTRITPFIIT